MDGSECCLTEFEVRHPKIETLRFWLTNMICSIWIVQFRKIWNISWECRLGNRGFRRWPSTSAVQWMYHFTRSVSAVSFDFRRGRAWS